MKEEVKKIQVDSIHEIRNPTTESFKRITPQMLSHKSRSWKRLKLFVDNDGIHTALLDD